jgi:hypothetical protein
MAQQVITIAAEYCSHANVALTCRQPRLNKFGCTNTDNYFVGDREVLINCPRDPVHLRIQSDRDILEDILLRTTIAGGR